MYLSPLPGPAAAHENNNMKKKEKRPAWGRHSGYDFTSMNKNVSWSHVYLNLLGKQLCQVSAGANKIGIWAPAPRGARKEEKRRMGHGGRKEKSRMEREGVSQGGWRITVTIPE